MAAKFVALSGASPADFTLPDAQVGGDNPENVIRRQQSNITLTRNGVVVSERVWTQVQRWTINYNVLSSFNVAAFLNFFNAKVFKLQPFGNDSTEYTVRWADSEFKPVQVSPGFYKLTFTIEEVLT